MAMVPLKDYSKKHGKNHVTGISKRTFDECLENIPTLKLPAPSDIGTRRPLRRTSQPVPAVDCRSGLRYNKQNNRRKPL